MSNIRIKDLSTEATSLGTDDFIPVDGNTSGTRRISKENLGTTLEIPNIGTSPQEAPLNQHLGSLAYQSAEAVSAGTVSAESLEVTDKITTKDVGGVPKGQVEFQDSGYTISGGVNLGDIRHDAPRHRWYSGATVLAQFDEGTSYFQNTSLGIGTSSPGSLSAAANNLVVGSGTGNQGLTVFSGSANEAAIYFADGTAGNQAYRSYIVCQHASDNLVFGTAGATRWTINSTGNLVAGSGLGIDFGSGASTTLDDYEEGTWTPTDASGAGLTLSVSHARYTKIGRLTHFSYHITYPTNSDSSYARIGGLPFTSSAIYQTAMLYTNYSAGQPLAAEISTSGTAMYLNSAAAKIANSALSGKFVIVSGSYT